MNIKTNAAAKRTDHPCLNMLVLQLFSIPTEPNGEISLSEMTPYYQGCYGVTGSNPPNPPFGAVLPVTRLQSLSLADPASQLSHGAPPRRVFTPAQRYRGKLRAFLRAETGIPYPAFRKPVSEGRLEDPAAAPKKSGRPEREGRPIRESRDGGWGRHKLEISSQRWWPRRPVSGLLRVPRSGTRPCRAASRWRRAPAERASGSAPPRSSWPRNPRS